MTLEYSAVKMIFQVTTLCPPGIYMYTLYLHIHMYVYERYVIISYLIPYLLYCMLLVIFSCFIA